MRTIQKSLNIEMARKLNLLVCEIGSGYGGSTAYLYSFIKHLNVDIFDPTIVFLKKADGPHLEKLSALNVKLVMLGASADAGGAAKVSRGLVHYFCIVMRLITSNFISMIKIYRLIREKKIDVVLLNQDVVNHFPSIIASFLARVPCVVRKGGVGTYQARRMWHFLSYFPAVFVAASNAEYRHHVKMGFPFKKMITVYEGTDLMEFSPGDADPHIRQSLGIRQNAIVVGSISRIDEGKGHDDFIVAASIVLKSYPDAIFLVVGDGDEMIKRRLNELTAKLSIQDNILFAGWRTDNAALLKAIDVFVHCPNKWREGMGIATLEAIASGKPVVITDNWGLSDTVKDGYNGFVVPIGDTGALADRIVQLIKNRDMRVEQGSHSRSRAIELFDIRHSVKSIEDIMLETTRERLMSV